MYDSLPWEKIIGRFDLECSRFVTSYWLVAIQRSAILSVCCCSPLHQSSEMNGASDASFDDALRQFLQITPIEPEQARFFLEATNGNLDMAVNMYTGE